ncbi:MAG: hypothetical protein P8Y24_02365 [Gammaproteobacteria bacterium]
MKDTRLIASTRSITLVVAISILLGATNSVSARDEKNIVDKKVLPSPIEKVGPAWKDVARKRKWMMKWQTLPDLVAYAETTDDPCTVELWIRNNSINGLAEEQWNSAVDAVRIEQWDRAGTRLVDHHDLRFNEVDFMGRLKVANGETFKYPWPLDPGEWEVKLIVDFASAIPEVSERNNEASVTTACPPGK